MAAFATASSNVSLAEMQPLNADLDFTNMASRVRQMRELMDQQALTGAWQSGKKNKTRIARQFAQGIVQRAGPLHNQSGGLGRLRHS